MISVITLIVLAGLARSCQISPAISNLGDWKDGSSYVDVIYAATSDCTFTPKPFGALDEGGEAVCAIKGSDLLQGGNAQWVKQETTELCESYGLKPTACWVCSQPDGNTGAVAARSMRVGIFDDAPKGACAPKVVSNFFGLAKEIGPTDGSFLYSIEEGCEPVQMEGPGTGEACIIVGPQCDTNKILAEADDACATPSGKLSLLKQGGANWAKVDAKLCTISQKESIVDPNTVGECWQCGGFGGSGDGFEFQSYRLFKKKAGASETGAPATKPAADSASTIGLGVLGVVVAAMQL